jgi:hypothetical protein
MRQIWTVLLLGTIVALPACASRNAVNQTEASAPTVTYDYDDDDDYDRVLEKADVYCDEHYDRNAVLLTRDREGDDYEATFRCE